MKGELIMCLCDKCAKFNKCYPKKEWPTAEQRAKITVGGCARYKELPVETVVLKMERSKRG